MNFILSKDQIKEIYVTNGPEGCFASNRITVEGRKIGYMYREEPDVDSDFPDSGWRFFAGDEDEEYTDNPDNFNVFRLNTICNYDQTIIPYLDAPYNTAYVWEKDGFVKD